MINAEVEVSTHTSVYMSKEELEQLVRTSLSRKIADEVFKKMSISKNYNPITDLTTYTGAIAGANYTNAILARAPALCLKLRVVEFTKNHKVIRVELQYYDDDWIRVPRIQIEEK